MSDSYSFAPAEIPSAAKPNPFDGVVSELADDYFDKLDAAPEGEAVQSKAVSFTISGDTKQSTIAGQLLRASKDHDVTIRQVYDEPDADGNVKVVIWAQRKRAPKGSLQAAE